MESSSQLFVEGDGASLPESELSLETPLVVDLDDTLVATDMLWESFLVLVKQEPMSLARLPGWLVQGKARLKQEMARRVTFDPACLPYQKDVLEFLRGEHRSGRRLILATASDRTIAQPIAEHLALFTDVLASDGENNLRGGEKLHAIRQRLGVSAGFDYVGDAAVDIPLLQAAGSAYLVNTSARAARKIRRVCTVRQEFRGNRRASSLPRAMRMHQWVKNLLIFVPLLLAHRILDLDAWVTAAVGFFAFSLSASAVYIINDLLDLSSDRKHPRKKSRPFAAGSLSIKAGFLLVPLLFTVSFGLSAALLPLGFTALLAFYVLATMAYSLHLKQVIIVDVLTLAGLYTLRILIGGFAVAIPISTWLMAFSLFFFLSLAFLKRYSELSLMQLHKKEGAHGRNYVVADMELLRSLGPVSGFLAVLVLALYISSDEVVRQYQNPTVLWLAGPLLLYWISRMWFSAHRGQLHDDPIVHAVKDPASYVVGGLVAVVIAAAALL